MIKSRMVSVAMWCFTASCVPLHAAQGDTTADSEQAGRWIIPFAAGGGTDVIARPIARRS
jgi:tripartite-type tricarboxylate transporter receptor subunit TctC